jgi:hypothetical protein
MKSDCIAEDSSWTPFYPTSTVQFHPLLVNREKVERRRRSEHVRLSLSCAQRQLRSHIINPIVDQARASASASSAHLGANDALADTPDRDDGP